MRRYDVWSEDDGEYRSAYTPEHPDGDWVKHEDVEALQSLSREALGLLEEFISAQFGDYSVWEAEAKALIIKAKVKK